MRVFAVALVLSVMLAAGPSYAQAPARPASAPAAQGQARPAAPAQAKPAQPAPAPLPFPPDAKYGYVYVQRIIAESAEGKADTAKVQALNEQKSKELQDKQKALQAAQTKLDQGGTVLNDAARTQLAADIQKQQTEIQRFTEDAQQDVQSLQQQLQADFMQKLQPIIDRIAKEKQLHMVFSATDSGLVWADPALDLTGDVVKAFDSVVKK